MNQEKSKRELDWSFGIGGFIPLWSTLWGEVATIPVTKTINMECNRMLCLPHCPLVQLNLCFNIRQGWQAGFKDREIRRGVGNMSVPGNIWNVNFYWGTICWHINLVDISSVLSHTIHCESNTHRGIFCEGCFGYVNRSWQISNTLKLRQNDHHIGDDI